VRPLAPCAALALVLLTGCWGEPEDVSRGRELLRTHCATCHQAPDPGLLAARDWPATLAGFELAFQAAVLFHHSNWRLAPRLDRALRLLLVTPRMHGSHHSQERREADANYGTIFSWWDHLHRSYVMADARRLRIGVPGYARPADNRWWRLLAMPFTRQRAYWRPDAECSAVDQEPDDGGEDRTAGAGDRD